MGCRGPGGGRRLEGRYGSDRGALDAGASAVAPDQECGEPGEGLFRAEWLAAGGGGCGDVHGCRPVRSDGRGGAPDGGDRGWSGCGDRLALVGPGAADDPPAAVPAVLRTLFQLDHADGDGTAVQGYAVRVQGLPARGGAGGVPPAKDRALGLRSGDIVYRPQ